MKKEDLKNKVKGFWDNNKGKIIAVGAVTGTVIGAVIANKQRKEIHELVEQVPDTDENNEIDYGRDCIITYSVEETGEVLWRSLCTESYVEDVKEIDSEYDNIRELNKDLE